MVTVYPEAEFDPLGPQTAKRMSRHDIVCLHTMDGSFTNTNTMFHKNGYKGTESHFGLAGDGRLKQWQDLEFRADANNKGNHRCISIETADRGEDFPKWTGGDVPAWTDAQIEVIVRLLRWLCDTFDIPKQLVEDSRHDRRGIAYHRLGVPHSTGKFDAPGGPWRKPGCELWSTGPKACPGDRRIAQLKEIVIPRVQAAGEEEDMPLSKDDLKQIDTLIRAALNEGTGNGQKDWKATNKRTLAIVERLVNEVTELKAQVKKLEQKVT